MKDTYRRLMYQFLCGFGLLVAHAFAADKTLDASGIGDHPVSLTEYFAILEDPSDSLTLADVQRPDVATRFISDRPPATSINFGFTASAYWLRLKLKNTSERPAIQIIEIANARLAEVDFHRQGSGLADQAVKTGYARPWMDRAYSHRFFVFPVEIAPGTEQIVYLRVKSSNPMEVPAHLWQRDAFHAHEIADHMTQAAYFGMVAAMILFNLLLWAALRDRGYGYYVLFVFGNAIGQAAATGLGGQYLWGDWPAWTTIAFAVGALFTSFWLTAFMRHMLGTAQRLPRYDKALQAAMAAQVLALALTFIAYKPQFSLLMVNLSALIILVGAIQCSLKGIRAAHLFLAAFAVLILGVVVTGLRIAGLVPTNAITTNGIQIGSAIEMILLAFALADRFNTLRAEKEAAQAAALDAEHRVVENLRESERVLEERVAQRTLALSESNRSLDAARKDAVQSLATIQAILDGSPVGLYLVDAQLRHTQVNKKYLQIAGCTAEQLLGHTGQRFHPSIEAFRAYITRTSQAIATGATSHEEFRMLNGAGAWVWVSVYASLIDPADPGRGAVVAVEDISERKKSEQEIHDAHQAVQTTLRDLQATQNQLIQAEKMASLGHLVANVAHEINTPIGAVKSSGRSIADALDEVLTNLPKLFERLEPQPRGLFAQLISQARGDAMALSTREERALRREVAAKLEEAGVAGADGRAKMLIKLRAHTQALDYLPLLTHPDSDFILDTAYSVAAIVSSTGNINTAVDRVSRIVFALKAFSSADQSGEMIGSSLREGIEASLALYQNQLPPGTEVFRELADLPPLWCIAEDLNQVWSHLIHNALKAIVNTGRPATLTVSLRQAGDEAVVSVTDTGCGIAADVRPKIFDAFFSTRAAGEGSGLGLAIVKKIVDKHHGRIDVHSEVGVGTTFSVYLPYGGGNS